MAKKGAVAAAVIGVGALGLGAVALMRSSDTTQKQDTNSMFSGLVGGGATGGYSDTTGVITPPSSTPTQPSTNIGDTIGGILSDIIQTPPQTQTPIIISPPSSGMDDLAPLINALDNPSDERSDYKQVYDYSPINVPYAPTPAQKAAEADLLAGVASGAYTITDISYLDDSKGSNTAVEYSPFSFAPTPKQADYSTYNAGKTGGSAANTPSSNTQTSKTPDNKTTQKSEPQNKAEYVTQKAVDLYSGIASTVSGFFGGLFGGK